MNSYIRLLCKEEDGFRLQSFPRSKAPSYVVLSHTWSLDQDDEVSFDDVIREQGQNKTGFRKLQFCCRQAEQDGLDFFWIDTCCIDKSDEEELQSSVSLMYQIYQRAAKCYALLTDVPAQVDTDNATFVGWESAFNDSRWFTRGWTLQELLAPSTVEFFSEEGLKLGNKITLKERVHNITHIAIGALEGQELGAFDVDERLSWTAGRQTTREEDQSYCLFGIFGVSMKIEYGEGREKARERLLEMINGQDLNTKNPRQVDSGSYKIQQHNKFLEWLSPLDFSAQQFDHLSRRQEGTGQWFIESPEFTGWIQGRYRTLLCPGIPGAGKTVIAAVAIDHLSNLDMDDVGLTWLFYNYRSQANQSATTLLAVFLKQLVEQRPGLLHIVERLYSAHKALASRPSRVELAAALYEACADFNRTYVVVDALDECSDQFGARSELIEQLQVLQSRLDVRVMFTSRPTPEVVDQIQADAQLKIQSSQDDVKRYVTGQQHRMPKFVQQDMNLQQEILEGVSAVTDGMFLLARLHCNAIASASSASEARLKLERLRSGSGALEDAYGDVLRRIDNQLLAHQLLGRKLMAWVLHGERLLTPEEMRHALTIGKKHGITGESHLVDLGDALAACQGLVVVDPELQIVRLVHYTTQQYLEGVHREWLPEGPLQLAESCLTYLRRDPFQDRKLSLLTRDEAWLVDAPLLEYCATNWGAHACRVEDQVLDEILTLLQDETLMNKVAMAAGGPDLGSVKAIHASAAAGLLLATTVILSGYEADMQDPFGNTPLSLAAQHGHEKVVALLAERPDVWTDYVDRWSCTPLLIAAKEGHTKVVELLIERVDITIDYRDRWVRTPLSWAAYNGHAEVVELLLDSAAVQLNSNDMDDRTPLSLAAENGHDNVVMVLVKRPGIQIDAREKCHGQTPLMWASRKGHEKVVAALLSHPDIDVNLKDKDGYTALRWASFYGHELVVEKLLSRKDLQPTAEDNKGRTALSWATERGHKELMYLFSKRDEFKVEGEASIHVPWADSNWNSVETRGYGSNKDERDLPSKLADVDDVPLANQFQPAAAHLITFESLGLGAPEVEKEPRNSGTSFKTLKGWIKAKLPTGAKRLSSSVQKSSRSTGQSWNNRGISVYGVDPVRSKV